MTTSGTSNSPTRLITDGATVDNVHISANYVVVEGFTVAGGGITLQGTGLTAQHNTFHDTRRGGIVLHAVH
jgi:hypothetical protein